MNARLTLALGMSLWFSASAAMAEVKVGFRQLTSTYPVAVQRGTEAEVQVRSNLTLDHTYQVFFARPGVNMTYAEDKPKESPLGNRSSVGTPFRFHVQVPEDQLPGMYEFRVATEQAVSSVSQLLVTDYPVVTEDPKKKNNTPQTAVKVEVPVAICGTVANFEEVDYYRFPLKAGQEITLEMFAQRVTDRIHNMVVRGPRIYLMDGILTLIGPNGQIVAQNDNHYGGDSFLHYKAATDGDYTLEVRDARYAGNARYTYCVEIAEKPYVHTVYPLAVAPGEKAEVEAVGYLLGDSDRATFTAPSSPGAHRLRVTSAAGETNPTTIITTELPLVAEQEPNDDIAQANAISVPQGINGRLEAAVDVDYYAFEARKGERFVFETEARRHGSPLDSVLEIQDAKGKVLAEADDTDLYREKDSRLAWTAPADGSYRVVVRDLHARGGASYVYFLRAERAEPDFELTGEYYYAMLAPGIRTIWFVELKRLNGFTGPVTLEVENLPPGVTHEPITIPTGVNHGTVILEAAADAPIGAALVHLQGRATITADGKEREIVRRAFVRCQQQSSGGGQSQWPIETQLVGVTLPLDLKAVVAEPGDITLKPGETKEIKVRIERQEGYTDAVTLATEFKYLGRILVQQLPPGVTMSSKSKARLSGKVLEGTIVLTASDKVTPVDRLPIAVVAQVSISFSINTLYASNPIYLTVEASK